MAKRILIVDAAGNALLSLSARHNDALEERRHADAFARDNIAMLERQHPGAKFMALEVSTRHGEDEAVLHHALQRLHAEIKPAADGTLEVLDISRAVGDATLVGGKLVYRGARESAVVAKPRVLFTTATDKGKPK